MPTREMIDAERSRVVSVMVVGEGTDTLDDILRHSNWDIRSVPDVEHAMEFLPRSSPCIVIAPYAKTGPAGWQELLRDIEHSKRQARMIVTDPTVDDSIWAEALNLGAYDVLAQPFEPIEVYRVVSGAWISILNER
ncbi:MAG: hypothetical protein SFV54_15460 [Bryobacteraceae bacterium]|nr:hypothetical protein [Bryobacteraceae bacterium]